MHVTGDWELESTNESRSMFQCLTRHKNTQAVQHSVGWSYYTKRFLSSAPCDSAVRVEVVQPPCPFPAIMNSSLGRWTERLICPEAVTDKQAYWWYARPHQGLRLFGARFTSNLLLKCLTRAWVGWFFFIPHWETSTSKKLWEEWKERLANTI